MVRTKKMNDRIHILEDRFECCTYLVTGSERALLFDTGCGADDLNAAAREITDLPLLVIASHGHFDHIAGSRFFEKVYLSKEDRNIPESYNEEQLNGWLRDMGCPEEELPICFGSGEWSTIADLDFDRFDLGDLEGRIITLPGHSHGSVGVYFPQMKVLLAGDALSPVMCLLFQNHGTVEEEYASVKKTLELDPDYYLTAHERRPFTGEVLQTMADCLSERGKRRFIRYQYPRPPYTEGYFYVHSLEGEPVGLIVQDRP